MKQLTKCFLLMMTFVLFTGQYAKIDAQEGEPFIPYRPEGSILDIEYSPDGTMIALVYVEGRVVVRETSSGTIIFDQTLPIEYLLIRARVAWSPTGDRLAAGVGSYIYIWDVSDFTLIQSLMAGSEDALAYIEQNIYFPAGFLNIQWSSDGEFLFANSTNVRITLWSFQDNTFMVDEIAGVSATSAILFANDQLISSIGRYLDIQTQTYTRTRSDYYYCSPPVSSLAGDSSLTFVVAGNLRGCISEIELLTGQEVAFYQLYEDGSIRAVVWSPDDSMIAAVDTVGRLYQIDRATSEFTVLADVGVELYAVDWSPDGEQIAYGGAPLASGEDSFSIVSLTENTPTADAGADQITTTTTVTLDGSASFDPDGEIVSYVWMLDSTEIATGAIAEVQLGVGVHEITLTVTDDDGATATDEVTITVDTESSLPGQGWLTFSSNRTGAFNIFAVQNESSLPVQLTVNTDSNIKYSQPVWSPDHTRIAFTRENGADWDICILTISSMTVNCNLSINKSSKQFYPAWSNSGNWLAYVSNEDGDEDIYKVAISGTSTSGTPFNMTNRTGTDGDDRHPDWRGNWIVYTSNRDGNNEIFIMEALDGPVNPDRDGRSRQQLTTTSGSVSNNQPAWSHQGNKIAYTSNVAGEDDIWIMTVNFTGGSWVVNNNNNLTANNGCGTNNCNGNYRFTAWSRSDDNKVAIVGDRSGNKDIYTANVALRNINPVAWNTSFVEDDPDW